MRVTRTRRLIAGFAGTLACAVAAGCTSHPLPAPPPPSNPASSVPAETPASGPTGSASSPTGSPAPAGTSATFALSGVRNLLVPASVRSALVATYVAYFHLKTSDIAGTAPGSVYYAYDVGTSTYWAKAIFAPSATASQTALVDQQDGGSAGLFTRTSNGAWQMRPGGEPPGCGVRSFFPKAVITAWALPQVMLFCPISTG